MCQCRKFIVLTWWKIIKNYMEKMITTWFVSLRSPTPALSHPSAATGARAGVGRPYSRCQWPRNQYSCVVLSDPGRSPDSHHVSPGIIIIKVLIPFRMPGNAALVCFPLSLGPPPILIFHFCIITGASIHLRSHATPFLLLPRPYLCPSLPLPTPPCTLHSLPPLCGRRR